MNVVIPNGYALSPAEKDALLSSPAIPTPAGAVSRFGGPRQVDAGVLFFISVSLGLTTVFAAMRIYVKAAIMKSFSIPDYLTIVAYGLFVGLSYVYYRFELDIGLFTHEWDISLRGLGVYLYLFFICVSLYTLILPTLKVAILLDWMTLFVPRGRRPIFWWLCQALLWANIIFYLTLFVLAQLICMPISLFWNPFTKGHCAPNGRVAEITSAAINLVSDVVIFVLPQTTIWNLHTTQGKRVGIAAIFAIGLIAVASSIARVVSVLSYYDSRDTIAGAAPFLLWTVAEIAAIFLVLCVPSCPRVFKNSKFLRVAIESLQSLRERLRRRPPSDTGVRNDEPGAPRPYYKISRDDVPLSDLSFQGKSLATSTIDI
ncbi:hypothetical protein F5X97DRAFT_191629 [Nemania serpens]|nr:hypothetical protein F5X97DRAFT_191629 [Nemania serpens]